MRSRKSVGAVAGIAFAALLSSAASGQTWTEQGDAPDLLPGQETQGSGALTQIDGIHDANDADLFKITITDAANFSATTTGGSSLDTQLFLFDANGMGVTHDDDDPNGGLQSRITGQFVPGPGVYFLAISTFNMDPNSIGGLIWNSTPFNVERAPDGPGAGSPLFNWTISGATAGTYSIFLTGAGFGNAGGFNIGLSGSCPGQKTLSWSGAGAGQMGILIGNGPGNFTIPGGPCQGTQLGLSGPGGLQLFNIISTQGGQGQATATVGTAACGKWVQAIKTNNCQTSNATGPI